MNHDIALIVKVVRNPAIGQSLFQREIEEQLLPFLSDLRSSQALKVNLYLSGLAIDALQASRNNTVFQTVSELTTSGRIELLTGLYYEPASALFSLRQLRAHLRLSVDFWRGLGRDTLGGTFFPHLAWDRRCVELLLESGMRFAVAEDAGVPKDPAFYCFAENIGATKPLPLIRPIIDPSYGNLFGETAARLLSSPDVPFLVFAGTIEGYRTLLEPPVKSSSSRKARSFSVSLLEEVLRQSSSQTQLLSELLKQKTPRTAQEPPVLPSAAPILLGDPVCERLYHRSEDLERLVAPFFTDQRATANPRRSEAERFMLRAQHAAGYALPTQPHSFGINSSVSGSSAPDPYRVRQQCQREAFEAIISGQVEIDDCIRPGIEPHVGWVNAEMHDYNRDGREELLIDTQLMRLYLCTAPEPALLEIDYKPRKIDLCDGEQISTRAASGMGVYLIEPASATITTALLQQFLREQSVRSRHQSDPAPPLVTRNGRDFYGIRFHKQLKGETGGGPSTTCHLELQVHAGIGAHLSNATTGFSIEYWLESTSELKSGSLLILTWPIQLPAHNLAGERIHPLLCVGGVSEHGYTLETPQLVRSTDVPGGLYGARLIDGIADLTIDFRTAKPLSHVVTLPAQTGMNSDPAVASGATLILCAEANRVLGDDKTITLFVSIL